MIKNILIAVGLWTVGLIYFLTPSRSHEFRAYPENLWTASGQIQVRSEKVELLEWTRVNFGHRFGSWLVYDRGVTEPAWYVRIDTRYLILYTGLASVPAVILFGIMEGLRRSGGEQPGGDNPD